MADMERYVGRTVDLVYIDKQGRITRRTVIVRGIRGETVRAFCCEKRAPRLFAADRILAVFPAGRRTG
ncbi:WYL domain-containing protein [Paenibacillus hodogayensis]|uniref:WYL domain-containing protein n=1 Tax=Paenibacillus hodogayensis TaxID=279208 RepID=A0ABV5W4D4_9BACL